MGSYTRIEKDLEVSNRILGTQSVVKYTQESAYAQKGGMGGLELFHTGALSAVLKLVVDLIHSSIAVSILC